MKDIFRMLIIDASMCINRKEGIQFWYTISEACSGLLIPPALPICTVWPLVLRDTALVHLDAVSGGIQNEEEDRHEAEWALTCSLR